MMLTLLLNVFLLLKISKSQECAELSTEVCASTDGCQINAQTLETCIDECGECDGGITSITFRNLGDRATCTLYDTKEDVTYGPTLLETGDEISAVGTKNDNKFGNDMTIDCGGSRSSYLHMSCSQPLYIGMVLSEANVEITAASSKDGGDLCPYGPCECDGGVTYISFENIGPQADCYIYDDKEDVTYPTVTVATGETFSAYGTDKDGEFGNDVYVNCGGDRESYIHMSCSQDIYVGLELTDAQVEVADGISSDNGYFCGSPSFLPTTAPVVSIDCTDFIDSEECENYEECCYYDEIESCVTAYSGIECGGTTAEPTSDPTTEEPCDECDGGITFIRLRNLGDRAYCSLIDTKEDVTYGPELLETGDEISGYGSKNDNKFGNDLTIDCGNDRSSCLHMSCSDPIWVGMILSEVNMEITRAESKNGGLVCDDRPCECDGGITEITFINIGDTADCYIYDKKEDITYPTVTVNTGDTFSASGTKDDGKFGNDVFVNCGGDRESYLHMSCSKDIYIGMELEDAEVQIYDGSSLDNGLLCNSPSDTESPTPGPAVSTTTPEPTTFEPTPSEDIDCPSFGAEECGEQIEFCCWDEETETCAEDICEIDCPNLGSAECLSQSYYCCWNEELETCIQDSCSIDCTSLGLTECEEQSDSCCWDENYETCIENSCTTTTTTMEPTTSTTTTTMEPTVPCELCDGGVTSITFTNRGDTADCYLYDEKEKITYGPMILQNGESISAIGTKKDNKFGNDMIVNCGNDRENEIHLSCSDPIYIGLLLDNANMEITDGTSKNGGVFCDTPEDEECDDEYDECTNDCVGDKKEEECNEDCYEDWWKCIEKAYSGSSSSKGRSSSNSASSFNNSSTSTQVMIILLPIVGVLILVIIAYGVYKYKRNKTQSSKKESYILMSNN